jgi:hypothetical protein
MSAVLTFGKLCISSLQLSGISYVYDRPSSLIQIAEFSESPFYCPLRDPINGLNVVSRGTLAEQFQMILEDHYIETEQCPV